jgi:plasmid stability protein
MMALMARALQVRDVPDEIHAELRSRAAAMGMSLSDYVLGVLEEVASHPPVADVLRRATARSGGAAKEDIVAVIRRARDAR